MCAVTDEVLYFLSSLFQSAMEISVAMFKLGCVFRCICEF